jgi:hypothetical protein
LAAPLTITLAACESPIATVPVTGVSLNTNSLPLNFGAAQSLTATVSPGNATNKAVTWSSSDTGIATVDKGAVTAIGQGIATITVTTEDGGKTAACVVIVSTSQSGANEIAAELAAYLQSLPANTAATPHTVTLPSGTVIDTDDTNPDGVWAAINRVVQSAGKYVTLDLSACSAAGNAINGDFDLSPTGNKMNIIKDNLYIKGIVLPDSLKTIGGSAFQSCTSLTSVTIPSSVTTIGGAAFLNCTSLTSVTIPSGVTTIGGAAFLNCSSLTSVTISSGVTTIEDQAFAGCSSLTSITIPSSVTTIGDSAFSACTSLTSVTFADGSNIADGNFDIYAFPGDGLRTAYLATNPHSGTYTRMAGSYTWTKYNTWIKQ